jgi:CBS domain-containing protein/sporulation protein YlmC with PRC-barrel domain
VNQVNRENGAPRPNGEGPEISLSSLLKNGVADVAGQPCGRVDDVIVRLRRNDYAEIALVVVKQGVERRFVLADNIVAIRNDVVELKSEQWAFKPAPLDEDEVSLRSDILCQRVIDLRRSALVRVYDVRLARHGAGWAAVALDVHRARWFSFGSHATHAARDWRDFLPLARIGELAATPSSPSWVGRLKPAQIADLIEAATTDEQDKLLEQVHHDPELEADVFEELEEDSQAQVFKSLDDNEIADVLSRMRADDAADAVMELAQERRQAVLDLLPHGERTKVMTLLGYNEATAGGLMGTEFLALSENTTVAEALQHIREATTKQPEALITIHCVSADGKLTGVLGIVQALQADPQTSLKDAADHHIVAASPEDDISTVVARMADFNLLSLPVVDEDGALLGVITVDDALEAALPYHWANR